MKDVNVGEKDHTIRKLITANRQLKEDLERESERYVLLENKHKSLLVEFQVLTKEHSRVVDLMFTQTTGGKLSNFQGYLSNTDAPDKSTSEGFAKKFEDHLY